ncbi:hypothetical protein MUP77_21135 [Candidatus Bathyarchaeota archaeon]|nr:hypothetical protein [Candidatus Bathyarchaeota archaeon]
MKTKRLKSLFQTLSLGMMPVGAVVAEWFRRPAADWLHIGSNPISGSTRLF